MGGKRIGQYELVRVLGRGAFGEVWLARDHRLERDVAIKRLKPEVIGDADVRRRFDLEAKTLLQVNEPHVVRVFDRIEIDGVPALVTEYMEGGSLSDLRKSREDPFTIEDVQRWAEHAAIGLSAIHSRGILHRDIKPANLFLSHDGNLSLGDFGLARDVETTQTLGLQGTGPYMSPEQIRGLEIDPRSDLFSLGIALYELTTGQRPFGDGLDRAERSGSVSTLRSEVPIEFSETIDSLLETDPERRIQSADELLERLRNGGDGRARYVRMPSRRRFAIGGLVAAAIVVAGLLVRPLVWPAAAHECDLEEPEGRRVLVLPFEVSGSEEISRLSADLPGMLASRLGGVADIEAPPPGTFGACSRIPDLVPNDSQGIRGWMEDHHTRLLVGGNITEIGGRLRVEMSYRYLRENTFAHDKSSITLTDAGEVLTAVNDIGLEVLRQLLREPSDDLSQEALIGVTSLEAMCAFLNGQLALRRWQFAGEAHLTEAVELDPGMAIAHYARSMLALLFWQGDERIEENLVLARQHDSRLSPYGLLLLESAEHELVHEMDQSENALAEAAAAYPDRPTAWLRMANLHFQNNPSRGVLISEARREFELAGRLDPESRFADLGVMWIDLAKGDEQALELVSEGWGKPTKTVLRAFTIGSQAARDSILAADDYCGVAYEGLTQMVIAFPDNERNIIQFLEPRFCDETLPADRAFFGLLLAHVNAGIGRWPEARDGFAQVPESFLPFRLEYEGLVMSLPFVPSTEEEMRRVIGELERWQPLNEPHRVDPDQSYMIRMRFNPHLGVHEHMRLYSLAALYARLGEYEAARAAVEQIPGTPTDEDLRDFASDLYAMGEARIAFESGDYATAFDHLERVKKFKYMVGGYSGFFHRGDAHYLRGLCLLELGRYEESIGWFAAANEKTEFSYLFNARSNLGKGRAFDALGRLDEAAASYRRFVQLMEGCDPSFEPEIAEVARRLAEIDGAAR